MHENSFYATLIDILSLDFKMRKNLALEQSSWNKRFACDTRIILETIKIRNWFSWNFDNVYLVKDKNQYASKSVLFFFDFLLWKKLYKIIINVFNAHCSLFNKRFVNILEKKNLIFNKKKIFIYSKIIAALHAKR